MSSRPARRPQDAVASWHLRIAWWALLIFLGFGAVLEGMHGLKLGSYLNVSNETRRFLWTLSHAHGTLLALVNLGFAVTLRVFPVASASSSWMQIASRCLFAATILLPGGFFLGGAVIYAGDPGLGVLLVPVGAALLGVAVLLTARAVAAAEDGDDDSPD